MSKGKRKQTHHHVRNVSIADDFPSHDTKVYMSTLKAGEADLDNLGDFEFLGRLSKEEVDYICEHNPTNIPYERLDFSALNEEDQRGTDEDIAYIIANVQHIDRNQDFDFAEFKKKFKKKNKLSRRRIKKICQAIDKEDEREMALQRVRNSLTNRNKESKQYFEEAHYINSSPLTHDEKLSLSTQEVGATKLVPGGLLSFMQAEQEMQIAGEVFELSGLDLIAAEIDPKTLKFKR